LTPANSDELSLAHKRIARRVVIVSAIAAFIIFGIRLSFSVFFAEFVIVEGWSSEAAATIYSASMVTFAIWSVPAGMLLDRFGPQKVLTSGAVLLSIGLFLSSKATDEKQLIITYGIIGGSGLSIIGLAQFAAVIAGWVPPEQRGRAIGIAFAGTGFGSLLFIPLCNWLIVEFGWRQAFVVLSSISLFALAPLLAIGQARPPQREVAAKSSTNGNLKQLFHNPLFWIMMIIAFNSLGPLRSLTVHQIAYIESTGIRREYIANAIGLAGFLTVGTFIGWGYVSDRFGRLVAFGSGAVCLMGAVGVLVLMRDQNGYFLLIIYSLLLALGEGTRSSQPAALASDIFQDRGLGLVNGLIGAMFGLGAAFGPWIVGRLYDDTGSYMPGLSVIVIMTIISVIGFLIVCFQFNRKQTGE
jgi:MFS family permease